MKKLKINFSKIFLYNLPRGATGTARGRFYAFDKNKAIKLENVFKASPRCIKLKQYTYAIIFFHQKLFKLNLISGHFQDRLKVEAKSEKGKELIFISNVIFKGYTSFNQMYLFRFLNLD